MANEIKKEFLQEHFRKHDTLTLYRNDGSTFTFTKKYNVVLRGGGSKFTFKTYDELMAFYKKQHLCLKPVINVG
jgi:hypothetical protein